MPVKMLLQIMPAEAHRISSGHKKLLKRSSVCITLGNWVVFERERERDRGYMRNFEDNDLASNIRTTLYETDNH